MLLICAQLYVEMLLFPHHKLLVCKYLIIIRLASKMNYETGLGLCHDTFTGTLLSSPRRQTNRYILIPNGLRVHKKEID